MLNDFNKAQDLLKMKITDLAKQLGDSEERFKHRESLDEDIEMINHLQVKFGKKFKIKNRQKLQNSVKSA